MGMIVVGAWAGEQWPVVSGTGSDHWEDLFEGHSWTTRVVLLDTVGVALLCCLCCVRSALANWKCTCDENQRLHGNLEA